MAQLEGKKVSYPSTRSNLEGDGQGFLFVKDGERPKSGVVVIHEWWGVNDFARDMSRRMAEEGFMVLAADVFRGHVFTTHPEARTNMMTMVYSQAAMDIEAAAKYLQGQGCTKVGVMGFGFGGTLAMVSTALHPEAFQAVAPNCGVPRPDLADISKIRCKVQGHYATKDKVKGVSSPEDVKAMEQRLAEGGVATEIIMYEAEHAFCVPDYQAYNPTARDTFLTNVVSFFGAELK